MRLILIGQRIEFIFFRLVTRNSFEIKMIKYGIENISNEFIDVDRKMIDSNEIEKILREGRIGVLENNEENEKSSEENITQILEKRGKSFSSYSNDDLNKNDCSYSKEFWQEVFPKKNQTYKKQLDLLLLL